MTTEEKIMQFFTEKGHDGITYDTDLFEHGYVNSLFALEIVMYLEKEFKIKIKNRDVKEKNFKNIHAMASLVESYLK